MGEVYRARDSQLHRDVAIKVLPDSFRDDPDRLARFEREARVLAAINHPHIASIYGIAEDEQTRGLVSHEKGIVHRDLKPSNIKIAYVDEASGRPEITRETAVLSVPVRTNPHAGLGRQLNIVTNWFEELKRLVPMN